MTYQEVLDYVSKKGEQFFGGNLELIELGCYYTDESNYRLLFDLVDGDILIDIEIRGSGMNTIFLWGIEEEVGEINNANIDAAFEIINSFLDQRITFTYYGEGGTRLVESITTTPHELSESEVNDWFNNDNMDKYYSDYYKNKKYKSGKDRIVKLETRYKYPPVVKTYIRLEDNLFHLV